MFYDLLKSVVDRDYNGILAAAGLKDCGVSTGFYKRGCHIVHESRFFGGSEESRAKAKKLLPSHVVFSA